MGGDDQLKRAAVSSAPAHGSAVEGSPGVDVTFPALAGLPVFGEWHQQEFDKSPLPMRLFDHETLKYLAVNDAALKLYGYSRQEFLKLTAKDTRHPDEHARLLSAMKEPTSFVRHRTPRRHVTRSGRVITVEAVTQDVIFDGRLARLALTIDVSDRIRLQELLYRRQHEFESLAENLPDLVARFDRGHRFVYVNAAVEKLLGKNRSDMIGRTQRELGMPDDIVKLFERSLSETLDSGMAHPIEFRVPAAGGERLFEAHHAPERDGSGCIATVLCIARDMTEHSQAEKLLRESNEHLRSVIESSRDCVKVLDLEGRLESMSQHGQRLLEIDDIRPLRNKSWLEFWKGADREAAARAVDAARKGGTGSFEGYSPTVKGAPRWWDVLVSPILDASGKPRKLLAVSRDITRRRKTRDDLLEGEERFRQLAENIRQVFWIATPKHDRLVYISPAYEEVWGKTRESLYQSPRSWMDPIVPEDRPQAHAAALALARGQAIDIEYRITRPDGALRWIRDRSYHMRAGDGSLLACGIAEDITREKLAEQERLSYAIQQRDALVREVHHRIKNSLQGVAGLLRQKVRKYPSMAPGIEEAIAQLQSVALVYGLQETRPDGLISLAEILDEVCASAEGLTGGAVAKKRERKSSRPACVTGAEAVSIAVALNELVFNALKHQPGNGRKRAQVTLLESRDGAAIRIANRGRLPKGFDFPAGREVGHGLGLVRTLLAAPGGSVAFNGGRNKVQVVLHLRPPLLAARQKLAVK
jgi:PAS domain S-box-containing protein